MKKHDEETFADALDFGKDLSYSFFYLRSENITW